MSTILRALDPPLGNYVRPARNDHVVLQQLLSENQLGATGVVIDPTLIARQDDLAHEAGRHGIETILAASNCQRSRASRCPVSVTSPGHRRFPTHRETSTAPRGFCLPKSSRSSR